MIWIIAGLFYGLFMAFYTSVNQNRKINGYVLGIWRGLGVAFVSMPMMLITPFIFDPLYLFLLVVQGFLVGFYDSRLFFSSAKFGAAETSRILVFSILISMTLWWSFHPTEFLNIWHRPFVFWGIIVSVLGVILCYLKMLERAFSKRLIVFMLPAVVVWSLMSTLAQEIMLKHELRDGIAYYLVWSMTVSGFYNLYFYIKTQRPTKRQAFEEIFSPKVVRVGLLVILFSTVLIISKSISLAYTPNTGYVNALSLTSPLWIMLYNHWTNRKDDASPRLGLLMIVFLFFLTFFACL